MKKRKKDSETWFYKGHIHRSEGPAIGNWRKMDQRILKNGFIKDFFIEEVVQQRFIGI